MSTALIGLGLHWYQPPTQLEDVLKTISRESYEPTIAAMEEYPFIKLSLNIARSLGERLPKEYLERLRALYRKGQLEMVNTIAYHPLAPITPRELLVRQIHMNEAFYREHIIGDDPLPGIFPPEMAFKQSLARLFGELGYQWCLADDNIFVQERSNMEEHLRAPATWIPEAHGVGVLLRSRERSTELAFKDTVRSGVQYAHDLIAGQQAWAKQIAPDASSYIYLYVDGETLGHHRKGLIQDFLVPFCATVARYEDARLATLNEIHGAFPKERTSIPHSSWSASKENPPFHLWDHPQNEFHVAWNEFIRHAYAVTTHPIDPEMEELFHKSFYSCSPWQYSMGNKDIARWCLPGFQRIVDRIPESWEKWRCAKLINVMYSLTAT